MIDDEWEIDPVTGKRRRKKNVAQDGEIVRVNLLLADSVQREISTERNSNMNISDAQKQCNDAYERSVANINANHPTATKAVQHDEAALRDYQNGITRMTPGPDLNAWRKGA